MRPFFPDVEDSPQFRDTAKEIEHSIEGLEKRCQKLIKGSRKYAEGISHFAESQTLFASFLEEFCGGADGHDEESMLLGGPLISKFVTVFRELGSYSELLRTQIEVMLCESLQHTWLKGLLADAKDGQKQLEKRAADYETARLKHLGHNKVNAKWMQGGPERAEADMLAAEAVADEARFEASRALTELQGRKRYEFLEAMVSSVDAHLRFFENGVKVLKGLEPYLQHALEVAEALKIEQRERMAGLEDAITGFCQVKAARAESSASATTSGEDTRGPTQMTGGSNSLASDLEAFIRATVASNGAQITVLKQGYLNKRSTNLRREWKRRFFVLDSQGLLYYYSGKERIDRRKTPQNTVNLLTSTIKAGVDEQEGGRPLKYCFRVVSTERVILLQADSEADMREWMTMLRGVIASLLGGSIDLSRIQQLNQGKPAPPTHSRHGSISSLDEALSGSPANPTGAAPGSSLPSFSGSRPELPASPERSARERGSAISPPREAAAESMHAGLPGVAGPPQLWGGRPPPAGQGTSGRVVDTLRRVEGNWRCADCSAPDPDWASLNLGILLCIQCSGVHRRLGVHISKVRSLTLDVRVWEGPVLDMMAGLGNAAVNDAFEEALRRINSRSDSWVWNDDSDDEGKAPALLEAPAMSPPVLEGDLLYLKPAAQHSVAAKEQFITAKYSERRFVVGAPPHVLQRDLWNAVAHRDLRGVMRAIARGADLNASSEGPQANSLAADVEQTYRGPVRSSGRSRSSSRDQATAKPPVLFLACKGGDSSVVELLLQNGATWDCRDAIGRTPLHYTIIFNQPHIAKALLQRGTDRLAKDSNLETALDIAIAKGAVPDSELFAMLSAEQPLLPLGQ